MSFKAHFSRTLERPDAPLHFAAHSHHPWPDVSFDAQIACWDDAARLLDRKWDHIFGAVRPKAQAHVARQLNVSDPAQVTFAQNTHEFLLRILSCLPPDRCLHILSTDSEFHSFTRQIARLEEEGLVRVDRIPVSPASTFSERFMAAAGTGDYDLVWFSEVFFNSGHVVTDVPALVGAVPAPRTFIVVDGYHSFMARPVDLAPIADRAFFLAGGYKYAMAGEGVAILTAPPDYGDRPRDTGWYAAFSALSNTQGAGVPFAEDASRFDGATFDPVGLYRLNAVFDWLDDMGLTVERVDGHARDLQTYFLDRLERASGAAIPSHALLVDPRKEACGRFLTFEIGNAAILHANLMARNIITDYRGNRLRIGFGLYQDHADVDRLIVHLSEM